MEELHPDLDYFFSMMPWEEQEMDSEMMKLFVQTFIQHEGQEVLSDVQSSLEDLINYSDATEILTKSFYQPEKPFGQQEESWEKLLESIMQTLDDSLL